MLLIAGAHGQARLAFGVAHGHHAPRLQVRRGRRRLGGGGDRFEDIGGQRALGVGAHRAVAQQRGDHVVDGAVGGIGLRGPGGAVALAQQCVAGIGGGRSGVVHTGSVSRHR